MKRSLVALFALALLLFPSAITATDQTNEVGVKDFEDFTVTGGATTFVTVSDISSFGEVTRIRAIGNGDGTGTMTIGLHTTKGWDTFVFPDNAVWNEEMQLKANLLIQRVAVTAKRDTVASITNSAGQTSFLYLGGG